jgi:hypothetical protein
MDDVLMSDIFDDCVMFAEKIPLVSFLLLRFTQVHWRYETC